MLYFTKFKVLSIYIFIIFISFFTFSNFLSEDKNPINKKINLGLDLQGGSYLLLEIDNTPIILQKLQNTVSILRKYFKNNNIFFKNLKKYLKIKIIQLIIILQNIKHLSLNMKLLMKKFMFFIQSMELLN